MSISISKAQKAALDSGFDFGGENLMEFNAVNSILEQYGAELLKNISKFGNNKGVVS